MGTIVAIGGGELGDLETFAIDEYIVKATEKQSPKALFIPTASGEPKEYIDSFNKVYAEKLGCITDSLLLLADNLTDEQIKEKILSSDLIYVGGGDTVKMMEIWRSKKVNQYLKEAYEKGIVLSGLSAGSICWFKYGHSDSNSFRNNDGFWEYIRAEGLGLIDAIHCPHYNEEGREGFDDMMKSQNLTGIALDNNCAFVIRNNEFKIVKSDINANAYKITNKNGTVMKELIENKNFKNTDELFVK